MAKSVKKKKKKKEGRPSVFDGKETVGKIIAAFHNGFNDTEACMYAQISRDAFYDELKRSTMFTDKVAYAKAHPNIKAKELVISNINEGDVSSAKWWLERRARNEFSTKSEVKHEGDVPMIQVDIWGDTIINKEEKKDEVQPETVEPTATS